tara:strand:- start:90 stop:305 length:216 start_codon:yes stop_codon:yes gene_type:complete
MLKAQWNYAIVLVGFNNKMRRRRESTTRWYSFSKGAQNEETREEVTEKSSLLSLKPIYHTKISAPLVKKIK